MPLKLTNQPISFPNKCLVFNEMFVCVADLLCAKNKTKQKKSPKKQLHKNVNINV